MELFVYTFKDSEDNERLCGYFRDGKPYPMVCDDRQRGRLDNYATEMAKNHDIVINCHKVETSHMTVCETFGGSNEAREEKDEAEGGDKEV